MQTQNVYQPETLSMALLSCSDMSSTIHMLKLTPWEKEPFRCVCSSLLYTHIWTYTEEWQKALPFYGCWFKHQELLTMIVSNCQFQPSCYDSAFLPSLACSCLTQDVFHPLVLASCTWTFGYSHFLLSGSYKPFFFCQSVGFLKAGIVLQHIHQSTPPALSTWYLWIEGYL